MYDVRQRIKELRKARGWTQRELGERAARAVGRDRPWTHSYVAQVERMETGVTDTFLRGVMAAFGVSLSELATPEGVDAMLRMVVEQVTGRDVNGETLRRIRDMLKIMTAE